MEWNEQSIITSQKNYLRNKLDGDYLLWYDTGKIKLEANRLLDKEMKRIKYIHSEAKKEIVKFGNWVK